ncbi:class I tRNA ligase family protein [Prauserella muralis]|uniref:Cysteine--tRNA ligase n=1 Tax=Prauserella muralis TaxID=588067 RepID=A0A2V4AR98_9PSEU|nr:class I tRNA ligase family protein [Prauserella muralis]PXY22909.1 cysteine--tRNA ligase [Prauserella muralis]TWE27934.1 cysteinyl-tRNA synthetase [Prauserella muralis]
MTFETMTRKRPAAGATAVTLGGRRIPLLDRARIYACGITPYDVTHLGHAATFVWVDTLTRALRALGVEPILCRNVTDVDDVLVEAARAAGSPYDHVAAFQQFRFEGDMAALGVRSPDFEPRAHSYIEPVIRLAAALVDSGAAYVRGGSVYFRGSGVAERAGVTREEALLLAAEYGGRPDEQAKDDPLDVAVWQAAEPGYPAWDSPWGPGRPGWHAECVAMSMSVFGVGVDVHAGGADLRFPHHAYHSAMAEAVTGTAPYARAWLHVGTVTADGVKMAKSAGNLVLVEQLLATHPAPVLRLAITDRAWGQSWDYSPAVLDSAATRLEQLHRAAGRPVQASEAEIERLRALLADDLNVPAALDTAIEAGGSAARLLTAALGLS